MIIFSNNLTRSRHFTDGKNSSFLGCGSIKKRNTPTFNTVDYKLVEFDKMENIIIPPFLKKKKGIPLTKC
jgi:hypothetical protein